MDADAIELRVLGCLLEKQRTTPDQYPLTLNALRLACNQTTNREPIVGYDEREIHEALQRLARRGWTRVASGPGSRAAKYRQLFDQELGLGPDATAVLCVLMLRGAQTPGELKQRTERLHRFDGLGASWRPSTPSPGASSSSASIAGRGRRRSATATSSAARRRRRTPRRHAPVEAAERPPNDLEHRVASARVRGRRPSLRDPLAPGRRRLSEPQGSSVDAPARRTASHAASAREPATAEKRDRAAP